MANLEIIGGAQGAASGAAAGTAIAPGVGTIIGAAIGGLGSYFGGRSSSKRAMEMMHLQRDWAVEDAMYAHQREVGDLRAAGLNPILSATGGAGTMPRGVPTAETPDYITPAVQSGIGAGSAVQAARTARLMNENTEADTSLKGATERQTKILGGRTQAEINKVQQEEKNLKVQGAILKENLQSAQSAAAAAKTEEEIDESQLGKVLRWINRVSKSVQGVGGSAKSVRDGLGSE